MEDIRLQAAILQRSTASLQHTVAFQNGKLKDLEFNKADLSEQLLTLQAENIFLDQTRDTLEKQLEDNRNRLVDSIADQEILRSDTVNKCQEIVQLQEALQLSNVNLKKLNEDKVLLANETSRYQESIRELESEKSHIALALHETQTLYGVAKNVNNELNELVAIKLLHTKELEEKLTQSNIMIQELNEAMTGFKESIRVGLIKRGKSERHKVTLDKPLCKELGKIHGMETELSESRTLQLELKSERKDSQEANEKLNQEVLSLQQSKSSIEEDALHFRSQLKIKVQEEGKLKKEIEELQQAKDELDENFLKPNAELEYARESEAIIKAGKTGLEASSTVLTKNHNQTMFTRALLQSLESRFRSENYTIKEEKLSLESKVSAAIQELRNQLHASETTKATLERELNTTSTMLHNTRTFNKKSEVALGEANKAIFETRQKLYELQKSTRGNEPKLGSVANKLCDTDGINSTLYELERSRVAKEKVQLKALAEEECMSKVLAAKNKVCELKSNQGLLQWHLHAKNMECEKQLQSMDAGLQRQVVLRLSSVQQANASSEDVEIQATSNYSGNKDSLAAKARRKSRNTYEAPSDSFGNVGSFRPWSSQEPESRVVGAGALNKSANSVGTDASSGPSEF